jgi:hypothetical protein
LDCSPSRSLPPTPMLIYDLLCSQPPQRRRRPLLLRTFHHNLARVPKSCLKECDLCKFPESRPTHTIFGFPELGSDQNDESTSKRPGSLFSDQAFAAFSEHVVGQTGMQKPNDARHLIPVPIPVILTLAETFLGSFFLDQGTLTRLHRSHKSLSFASRPTARSKFALLRRSPWLIKAMYEGAVIKR